jgi:hypothetical protein
MVLVVRLLFVVIELIALAKSSKPSPSSKVPPFPSIASAIASFALASLVKF